MGWLRCSPSDFVFTVKLPKHITHDEKSGLKEDVQADLEGFLDMHLRITTLDSQLPMLDLP
jgi:uncharacterized protein YecE (DUF72 family)